MTDQGLIPQGEDMITVQLTVKEALALGGGRFTRNPQILFDARRKLNRAVEKRLLGQNESPIHYEELSHS